MTQRLYDWLQAGSPLHSHFYVDENRCYGASACAGTGVRVFRSCLAAPPSPARSAAPPSLTHRPGCSTLRYLLLCCGLWLLTAIGAQAQPLELAYTIDSLREMGAEQPQAQWFLIIGQDQYAGLHTWRDWPELLALVTLAVANRPGQRAAPPAEVLAHPHRAVPLAMLDISATDIRQRVAAGADISHLVPPQVARYIETHRLYRACQGLADGEPQPQGS